MPDGKPNILVIGGDDIGISNLSCYSDGMMGYRTPNIDLHGFDEFYGNLYHLNAEEEPEQYDYLHPLGGQRAGVLDRLLADGPELRIVGFC
jgi:arylsulfatase A-like enzyme